MLIPKNTSLPPPPSPPVVRNAAAGYNWLQDGAREDERMREKGGVINKKTERGRRLSSSVDVEEKRSADLLCEF